MMISTNSKTKLRSALRALVGALLVAVAPAARAADEAVAAATGSLRQTVDEVIAVVSDPSATESERLKRVEAIALDRFDFPRMTALVLAKNKPKLSADQQAQFAEEFKRHLSLTYGRQLNRFTDQKVEVGEARLEVNKDVTVKTRVVGGGREPIAIDYRLRHDGTRWKILDVVPEGVSLIQNFKSQVQEIVSTRGVDELIRTLHDKNEAESRKPAVAE